MSATLSVIMANYNHAHFLGEALEALFAQGFPPTEVVVVDDASTDDSLQVIETFARRYPALKLLRQATNQGAVATFQRALGAARGQYVFGHSADDRVLPGFFEKSIDWLERHPESGLCTSVFAGFNSQTGEVHNRPLPWGPQPRCFTPAELAPRLNGGFIPGHTSIYRREALMEAGGYLSELRWHCDWFASLVVAARHGVCYLPEHLSLMREDPASYSASGRRQWEDQRGVLGALLRLLGSPEYADVVPFFVEGRVLATFGDDLFRAVAEQEDLWTPVTYTLLSPLVGEETRDALRKLVAHRLRARTQRPAPAPREGP